MKKGINGHAMATFSLADLPSGERSNVEKQIMEHAVAHWRERGGRVKTASNRGFYSEEVHDNRQR
jgi:hypothetical protein